MSMKFIIAERSEANNRAVCDLGGVCIYIFATVYQTLSAERSGSIRKRVWLARLAVSISAFNPFLV